MKASKKLIIVALCLLVIFLIIFILKDFIIRQYFTKKIENVNFDEYILNYKINNEEIAIYYYKNNDKYIERRYENGELSNYQYVTDVKNKKVYTYNIENKETSEITDLSEYEIQNFTWNNTLVDFLKNENQQSNLSFKYDGIENINNIECYTMTFEDNTGWKCTAYVNKELFNVVKLDFDLSLLMTDEEIALSKSNGQSIDNGHIIWEYELDLNLKQKDLFEINVEK